MTRANTEALRERYERLHKHDAAALAADIRAVACLREFSSNCRWSSRDSSAQT